VPEWHAGGVIDYSATGEGSVLLLCPGGDGDPAGVAALGAQLADAWTVVTYRRAGHPTIAEHAADAAAVLEQVGGGPAEYRRVRAAHDAVAQHLDPMLRDVDHQLRKR
jgi:hypothetical protein